MRVFFYSHLYFNTLLQVWIHFFVHFLFFSFFYLSMLFPSSGVLHHIIVSSLELNINRRTLPLTFIVFLFYTRSHQFGDKRFIWENVSQQASSWASEDKVTWIAIRCQSLHWIPCRRCKQIALPLKWVGRLVSNLCKVGCLFNNIGYPGITFQKYFPYNRLFFPNFTLNNSYVFFYQSKVFRKQILLTT